MTAATPATPLVAEDLLLLLFDPASGTIRGEGTPLFNVLAGAALVDLAFGEHVDVENQGWLRGKEVAVTGPPPTDPILRDVRDRLGDKPLEVHAVIAVVGPYLRGPIIERLVERGHLRQERRRLLGFIPTTALVDGGTTRRAELIEAVRPVLVDGAEPDARTAALAALLSASDTLPRFHPDIAWSGAVYTNGKRLERGSWGTAAAAEVVARAAAAMVAASFVAAITPAITGD